MTEELSETLSQVTLEAEAVVHDVSIELEAQGDAAVAKFRDDVTSEAECVLNDVTAELAEQGDAVIKRTDGKLAESGQAAVLAFERQASRYETAALDSIASAASKERDYLRFVSREPSIISHTEFQRQLIQHYEKRHCSLGLSPLLSDSDEDLETFYVPPKIEVVRERTRLRMNKNQSTVSAQRQVQCFRDIFYLGNERLCDIYLQGESGIGKSVFCTKIIQEWCKANKTSNSDDPTTIRNSTNQQFCDVRVFSEFKYLFFISLRDSSEVECDIDAMIVNQVIKFLPKDYNIEFLQRVLAEEICLVLLDGLDEWSHPEQSLHKCSCGRQISLPFRRTRENCTILSTTRPWVIQTKKIKNSEIDVLLQLCGVSHTDMFVEKALSFFNETHDEQKSADDFHAVIKSYALEHLVMFPTMCIQLLCCWYADLLVDRSQTQIYSSMVDMMFGRAKEKKHDHSFDSSGALFEPSMYVDFDMPELFSNAMNILDNRGLFLSFGNLAYNTLVDWQGGSSGVFDGRSVWDYLTGIEWSAALEIGILTQRPSQSFLTERRTTYSFLHRSIQEFMAAAYIAICCESHEECLQCLDSVCAEMDALADTRQRMKDFIADMVITK
ncbi:uncharacterized protein LOC128211792 [Mya arenaria]|uniref:uncharacterized protein LOC128211792 n=1 Tax=Mya arenaria TaxID=6604 RepID=UPI0022DEED15|nr:uncharacterized protein LOC128211792 [Mya arenaria]XP_052772821.1 uncharacterized protein LOC128211792 [Mya arenaria]XP_052772822.1 uncharacterized protein LOC128211792 [Mya arenaria]XP_052772823.1 uncharacterized protein LOC128211792 [Mya arenaria]